MSTTTSIERVFEQTDWASIRARKRTLKRLSYPFGLHPELAYLVEWIDQLQDAAYDAGYPSMLKD